MSSLSSALAAALQNSDTIGPLITGVIPGRNFELQDAKLAVSPYACLAVADLPIHESPYIQSGVATSGQIEVRCISKSSEAAAKELAEAVKSVVWAASSFPWQGGTITFGITALRQDSMTSEDLSVWEEVLTVDYES